jgi:hypothetical protein
MTQMQPRLGCWYIPLVKVHFLERGFRSKRALRWAEHLRLVLQPTVPPKEHWLKLMKGPRRTAALKLILLFASLLPASPARQSFLDALLFAGFQIKGVTLDLLNNVFLLHFALEAT